MDAYCELKDNLKINHDLFSEIINGDESWSYAYESETKQHSSEWRSLNSLCCTEDMASEVQHQDNADFFFSIPTALFT